MMKRVKRSEMRTNGFLGGALWRRRFRFFEDAVSLTFERSAFLGDAEMRERSSRLTGGISSVDGRDKASGGGVEVLMIGVNSRAFLEMGRTAILLARGSSFLERFIGAEKISKPKRDGASLVMARGRSWCAGGERCFF